MFRNRQRGESQFGCLVGLILLLAAGVLAYKLIPVKVKAADMRDTVVDEAKADHSEKVIVKNILRKAEELEFPITADNIKIKRSSAYIEIDVEYTVPVELPGFTYEWSFHHHAENPRF